MADPLSAAGTAVGIVSLGLQVSQGLITYYSHFKAHDEEIAYLVRKSESLHSLLQALNGPLRKAETEGGDVSIQVRNAVVACETGLQRLFVALEKYGNLSIPATVEDKLRALRKRTLYPFRRGTLQELNVTLEEVVGSLQLALQILNLESSQSHKDALTQATSSSVQQFSTNFEALFTKVDQLTLSIQSSQAHLHLYRQPALLASRCQDQQELQLDLMEALEARNRRRKASRKPKNSLCSCHHNPRTSERRFNLYGLSSFWSRTVQHLPQCPLSRYAQQRVDTIGVKYTYCTKILGYSIAATFSAARGPGGLAINPQLTLRAVVPKDSPAFRLVGSLYPGTDVKFSTPINHANWVLHQLNMLFNEGKASPTDVTEDGETLLHLAVDTIRSLRRLDSSFSSELVQATGHLIDGITTLGADPLQRGRHDRTLMDIAVHHLSTLPHSRETDFDSGGCPDLLVKLFDYGLAIEGVNQLPSSAYTVNSLSIIQSAMKRLTPEQRLGTIEGSDILKAIYLQDEVALEKATARFPEDVNRQYRGGTTALHISTTWPEGLLILLERGADPKVYDLNGHTPVSHACYSPNFSSLSLLLDHDSPLGGWGQNDCLRQICQFESLDMKENFIFHLVDRCKRLLDLALESLPRFELEMLNLKEDRVLDSQASAVTSALLKHGVEIHSALMPSFEPYKTTVYHTYRLDVSTANILFEAGFRDIDEINENERTPFWSHSMHIQYDLEDLELLQWFRDKDVDVYHRRPKCGGTAMHALGSALGEYLRPVQVHRFNMRPPTEQQVGIAGWFLQNDATDDCLCACSKNGCRIITSALKNCRGWYSKTQLLTGEEHWEDIRLPTWISILQLAEANITESPWMPFEGIRVMTFEWLELTHTCHVDPKHLGCKSRGPLSQDETADIQEEERYLLEQHEELVTAFETKFTELGISITAFLEEHWAPAMLKVLDENEAKNVEEEAKMRGLGVVVDEWYRVQELGSDEEEEENEDAGAEQESENEEFHECEEGSVRD